MFVPKYAMVLAASPNHRSNQTLHHKTTDVSVQGTLSVRKCVQVNVTLEIIRLKQEMQV